MNGRYTALKQLFEKSFTRFILKLVIAIAAFFLLYLLIRYLLPAFWPFVLAIVIALIDEPVVDFFEIRLKLSRKISALLSLLFTTVLIAAFLTFSGIRMFSELIILKDNTADYLKNATLQVNNYISGLTWSYSNLPFDPSSMLQELLKTLVPRLEGIITFTTNYVLSAVSSLPETALSIIVTIISSYYISSDRRMIRSFIYKQLPDSWSESFPGIKGSAFKAIYRYFRAQLILMSFTFIEFGIGLTLIRSDYILIMSLLVGLSEAVPILGTGIIMIPWLIWHLMLGNTGMVLYLLILFLSGAIVKLIVKPFIMDSQTRLHPLVALLSMYIGLYTFGILGMILAPVFILTLRVLNKSGTLSLWKE